VSALTDELRRLLKREVANACGPDGITPVELAGRVAGDTDALVESDLVDEETLEEMTQWRRLSIGLDYGYGVARFRPIPLLSKYRAWGGIGATNSFTVYSPGTDVYLIGTFNQTAFTSTAYRFTFRAIRTASKVESSE